MSEFCDGWMDAMRPLLGKRVEVTIADDTKISGVLQDFTEYGEVRVQQDDGAWVWAWPNLHIREVAE